MGIDEEIDDQEFIISEQRHRETTGILKDIAKKLSEDNKGDDRTVAAIEKLIRQVQDLVKAEKAQEKFEKQPVKVDLDTTNFVTSVEQLGNTILTGLNELKEIVSTPQPHKKWEFTVKRNGYSSFIESITAIQK